jgi:hypothetical protein
MMRRIVLAIAIVVTISAGSANAQLSNSAGRTGGTRVPTLTETLVNNLHATRAEQQDFLKVVVEKTEDGSLDKALVVAVMRYSQRRNQRFPFPFFEKAIRFQAAKRDVALPAVATIASSRFAPLR